MSNHDNLVSVKMPNGIELILPVSSDPLEYQMQKDILQAIDRKVVIRPVDNSYDPNNAYAGADGDLRMAPVDTTAFARMADKLGFSEDSADAVSAAFAFRDGSNRAAASAAASASRQMFFRDENAKIDAQHRIRSSDLADAGRTAALGQFEAASAADLASLASRRTYDAESAALSLKDATGQAAFNQSQLDSNLAELGLGAADYRRGESVTADPYRALEADQAGAASGQRRYAQDVRAAASASEEKKILLAEQKVAQAKAESDRSLAMALDQIASGQRNSDRSFALSRQNAQTQADNFAWTQDFQEKQADIEDTRWFATNLAETKRLGGTHIKADGTSLTFAAPDAPKLNDAILADAVASGIAEADQRRRAAESAARAAQVREEADKVRVTNSYAGVPGVVV